MTFKHLKKFMDEEKRCFSEVEINKWRTNITDYFHNLILSLIYRS